MDYEFWIPKPQQKKMLEEIAEKWEVSEVARSEPNGWWWNWYYNGGAKSKNNARFTINNGRKTKLPIHRRNFLSRHLKLYHPFEENGILTRHGVSILIWHFSFTTDMNELDQLIKKTFAKINEK